MTNISRRGLFGILAAACSPAIIRTPGLLMPIKPALLNPVPEMRFIQQAGSYLWWIDKDELFVRYVEDLATRTLGPYAVSYAA